MIKKSRRTWIVASSAVSVVMVIGVGVMSTHVVGGDRHDRVMSTSHSELTRGAVGSSTEGAIPDVSAASIDALDASGVEVEAVNTLSATATNETTAIDIAQSEFPGMLAGRPVEASVMTVTIAGYGTQLQPDVKKPSEIRPRVANEPAWVLVFNGVDVPLMGSFNEDESESLPTPAPSRFVVLIDAESGAFIHARTF